MSYYVQQNELKQQNFYLKEWRCIYEVLDDENFDYFKILYIYIF